MNSTLGFFAGWTFVSLTCGALWIFMRSDSAVRRLDALSRRHPFIVWTVMLTLLVASAVALVFLNTEAAPAALRGTTA
ncbi:hypothetical protein BC1002_6519 [Paraburkholderia atlantica]|uniref:Uncharacterized protein n=1 Tax=Paraburkholderia atlantica TaxID=2654982 RepID=D5WMB5_PARAM|nr:hypothetical protein [Paraburkholderia atlantica]ADG20361.1 hypothetical protein BC1002_6519 [Paraburkholderia atlantica]